jgi:hypothetical protein
MLQPAERRVWTLRIAFSLATFVLGWILLALVSSNWFQPDEVQKLVEKKLLLLPAHPRRQIDIAEQAARPNLATAHR